MQIIFSEEFKEDFKMSEIFHPVYDWWEPSDPIRDDGKFLSTKNHPSKRVTKHQAESHPSMTGGSLEIRDKSTRRRVIDHLKKLEQLPDSGKPLKYNLKGHRSTRVPPFRIIYRIEQDRIIINCFDHRKDI